MIPASDLASAVRELILIPKIHIPNATAADSVERKEPSGRFACTNVNKVVFVHLKSDVCFRDPQFCAPVLWGWVAAYENHSGVFRPRRDEKMQKKLAFIARLSVGAFAMLSINRRLGSFPPAVRTRLSVQP
jgi:hypothetical protein